ncbi:hypothetical protein [Cruoricaptor ignavus]|nr:hypothetical protein [Cruoricaptor ignavus]
MGIEAKFDQSAIERRLQEARDILEFETEQFLNLAGMEIVNYAKDNREYKDQTKNLFNSTGYIVVRNGRVIKEGFEGGQEGEATGRGYAHRLATQFADSDWALIIVAGMEYASYVEDVHHRDVLQHSKNFAPEVLEQMKQALKNRVEARLSRL